MKPTLGTGWAWIPARDLNQHQGCQIQVYRSRIPTLIVAVSEPNSDGMCTLDIMWTEPTAVAGGLIRHEAGRREQTEVHADEEYPVRVGAPDTSTNPGSGQPVGERQ